MHNPEIDQKIMSADDLISTIEYESAGPNYLDIKNEDLSQQKYANIRRIKKITYSSVSVGHKSEYIYNHRYPRNHSKYAALNGLSMDTMKLKTLENKLFNS